MKMAIAHRFRAALVTLIAFCVGFTCFADSYAKYAPKLAISNSNSTFGICSSSLVEGSADVVVATRLHPAAELGNLVASPPPLPVSLMSGEVRFLLKITIPTLPSLMCISDTHVATIDSFGPNNFLKNQGDAIIIVNLRDGNQIKFRLEDLVDLSKLKVSGARVNWIQSAWFTIDDEELIVALGDVSLDGGNGFLKISIQNKSVEKTPDLERVILRTPSKSLSSLVLCAYRFEIDSNSLRKIADDLSVSKASTVLEGVIGHCYRSRVVKSKESRKELRNTLERMKDEFNSKTPATSMESISLMSDLGDPMEIAENELLRLTSEANGDTDIR